MGGVVIVPAEERDFRFVAYNMRKIDQLEVFLTHRHEPSDALFHGEQASLWTMAARDESGCVCIFGLAESQSSDLGHPWCLGTDRVKAHPVEMVRLGREWVATMLSTHRRLVNFVYTHNMDSRRWLERIGFTVDPDPEPYGEFGTMFNRFWMEG